MKRILAMLAAAVLAGSSLSGSALAYTPEGDDYLCDDPQDLSYYRLHRWFGYELPLKVYVPPIPFKTENPAMYAPVIRQAFESWLQVIPQFKFKFVSDPKQAQIRIKWVEHFPESEAMWGQALLPIPYLVGNKVYHKTEVHLAVRAQPGSGMNGGSQFFSSEELSAIATHEVGHALGLLHSKNEEDLMSAYMFRLTASTQWGITARDAATLRRLYSLPVKIEVPPCNGE